MATKVINHSSTTLFDRACDPSRRQPVLFTDNDRGDADTTFLIQHVPSAPSNSSPTRHSNGNMSSLRKPPGPLVTIQRPPPPPSSRAPSISTASDSDIQRPKPPPPPPPPPPPGHSVPLQDSTANTSRPYKTRSLPDEEAQSDEETQSDGSVHSASRHTSEPWGNKREELLLKHLQRPVDIPPPPLSTSSGGSLTESEDMFGASKLQFPPLLPTVGSRAALFRNRKQLTHAITSKARKVDQTDRTMTKRKRAGLIPSLEPGRGGTSTMSDASESSFSAEDDKIQQYWGEIKESRINIGVMKQFMAEEREKMRQLRRRKDETDAEFMNWARRILASRETNLKSSLDRRYYEMRRSHDEYQHTESRYEQLELELDKREQALDTSEINFFSLIARRWLPDGATALSTHVRESGDGYERDVPFELLGISWNGPRDDNHPYWVALVDAIGDLGLAQEELEELRLRREQIKYDTELNKTISKRQREDNEEFLREFPQEEVEKEARLEETKELVQNLREKCQQHGAMKKHPSYAVAYALDPNIDEDLTLDDTVPRQSLAHDRFPTLMSCPDHVLRQPEPLSALGDLKQVAQLAPENPGKKLQLEAAMKEYGIHQLVFDTTKEVEETDFVQRWLLHQVRTCPLEAYRLASVFQETTNLTIKDHDRWQHDVLRHWWRDGTSNLPEQHGTTADQVLEFMGDFPTVDVASLSLKNASGPSISRASRASMELPATISAWETPDSSKAPIGPAHIGKLRDTQSTGSGGR